MYELTKRFLDACVAFVGLVVLAPLLLLISAVVATELGRPVLFKQVRPGRSGRPFEMLKFRTMREPVDGEVLLDTDSTRLTRLGRILRSSSLDELPELWNVVRGDMSLVGPRPLLMEYLPHYTPEQARRHEVRPGITGWAQTHGRNALSWDEKFAMDVWYVDHRSLALDVRILYLTVGTVFSRRGVSAEGGETAVRFDRDTKRDGSK